MICDLKRSMHPIFLKLNFIRMYFMKIRMVGFMILINMEKCHNVHIRMLRITVKNAGIRHWRKNKPRRKEEEKK